MGVTDSTLKTLMQPCQKSWHDCNKYMLDDCSFDSSCSKCCEVHIKTNPHKDAESDGESFASLDD